MTVEQYFEFLQSADEFIRWQNEGVESQRFIYSPEYQLERLRRMANMIADFSAGGGNNIPRDHLFSMPVGDFERSIKTTFGLDNIEDLDFDKSEGTLYNIWALIYKVIATTKFNPDTADGFSFIWKDEKYTIKKLARDHFTGMALPPELSVQEAVEVLDLRKKSDALLASKKHDPKNINWERFHKQLAILALKDGEVLPDDDLTMETWVSKRAAHFIGIDAQTALQVDFFLAGPFGLLRNTLTAITFSTPLAQRQLKTQRPGASSKPKTKPSRRGSGSGGSISD